MHGIDQAQELRGESQVGSAADGKELRHSLDNPEDNGIQDVHR
jgi:hypothetical protein